MATQIRPKFERNLGQSFGKPARLVRAEGLEPPRLSSREPKSRASTNSATPATRRAARWGGLYHAGRARHYKNGPHSGGRLSQQRLVNARQHVRQVLGNQPRTERRGGLAMEPYRSR